MRSLRTVDEGEEYLAARVAGARAVALLPARRHARLAMARVVCQLAGAYAAVGAEVEGLEITPARRARTVARDAGDGMHFKVERARAVHDDMVFVAEIGKWDAVCCLLEQVYDGRAVQ